MAAIVSTPWPSGGEALRVGMELRVADWKESGQQRYLWRLGAWLADRGAEVHFVSTLEQKEGVEAPPGVRIHRLAGLSRRALRERVRSLQLDVLMLNPERARRFRGLHANVLRPGYGTEHYRQKLRSFRKPLPLLARRAARLAPWEALERRWERRFYEAPDPPPEVIAVSGLMRTEILDSYDIPPDRVHLVHNGVDLEEFNPARRQELRAEERDRWGIPPDAFCLLFMGHNYRLKGLWPLLDVLRRLRAEAPAAELHLLVAGRGTGDRQRGSARRYIHRHDLDRAVHLAGPIRPAVRAFSAADAFLHLAWHDAFGNVALEAMACGIPVITTPYVGAAELIENGVSGLIVDPADPDAVIAGVRRVLDPGLRRRMGEAAVEVGRQHPEEENFRQVAAVFGTAARRASAPVR